MTLVSAQEARRVLDRFCGYLVSGPLSRAANTRLSAGRVQSPAARLVVERERAIKGFVSVTHYGAELSFAEGWSATWITKLWLESGQEYLLDKALAEVAAALRTFTVRECTESESRTAPPAPFTTSSLQQAASNALKFTPKQTMQFAQKLYESGHITYMRTDSPILSAEAVAEIRAFCQAHDWPLVDKSRIWKSKEGAQEAHEAVRPTHPEVEEAGDTPDEQALYRLIRLRTLASQLADALYDVRVLHLKTEVDGKEAVFEARGRVLRDFGWKVLTSTDTATQDEEADADAPESPVPMLDEGHNVTASGGKLLTKKTKPPTRFSEASLVRELENRGIGRPAAFTAKYPGQERKAPEPTEFVCNACGKPLVHMKGQRRDGSGEYDFFSCSDRACNASYPNVDGKPGEARKKSEATKFKCTCGKPLVRRESARGAFFGCIGYPACKKIYQVGEDGKPDFAASKGSKKGGKK